MVEKLLHDLLSMDGGGPVLTLLFVFLVAYFLYHQIVRPNAKVESTDTRLSKIELGIHDLRSIMQHNSLSHEMTRQEVGSLKSDMRDVSHRLIQLETEIKIYKGVDYKN